MVNSTEQKLRDYLKLVTSDLKQTRRRLQDLQDRDREPIAIVGAGCRFAGGVRSPQDLWRLLADGRDAISPFPDDRGWDLDTLFDADPDHPGTTAVRSGGFLHDAAEFDADFFEISPREAAAMDPQQRLLLETSWEALERAGIRPAQLSGSATGVFAGVIAQDYTPRSLAAQAELGGHILTGSTTSVASGRVAYTFGLEGPAVTVDTACSSSLVAIHLAVRSLRSGECDLALAGGVTVMSGPEIFIDLGRQHALSADGRCKAFSAAADGFGPAEGAGMLALERLSDARRHGRPVLAVIRGSAVNSDGASNGLTAPSGPAQERVIGTALADAGLGPDDVQVVEAHGTGTALGDPIEADALLAQYGAARPTLDGAVQPLLLGSVKSNLGHTQAAAGVAGILKLVLALQHERLPRTLHAEEPSTHVDWAADRIRLLTESTPWPRVPGRPRRGAVSSFGISGTNAHLVLEEAPDRVSDPAADPSEAQDTAPDQAAPITDVPITDAPITDVVAAVLWPLSARTGPALREQAARLAAHCESHTEVDLAAVAAALAGRTAFEQRAAVTGSCRSELLAGLESLAADDAPGGLPASPAVVTGSAGPGRTALLFSGQGGQRVGMGAGLYGAFPVFAAAFDEVCGVADPLLGRSLREVVFGVGAGVGGELLGRTEFAQVGLFAVEVGLFRLVESWGVVADVLVGHSVGEFAVAYVAGVLSLGDAVRLVVARGRLMQELAVGGVMVAVGASLEEVSGLLVGRAGVGVAAVNGPGSVVVSGVEGVVAEVVAELVAGGRRVRRLEVGHGFHSPLMEPMLAEFAQVLGSVEFGVPRVAVVSTVSGALVEVGAGDLVSVEYWVRHAREAVLFGAAVEVLAGSGVTRFVEVGPDATLTGLVAAVLPDPTATLALPVLRSDRPEPVAALGCAGALWADGLSLQWHSVLGREPVDPVAGPGPAPGPDLPTYAFQRRRYWTRDSAAPDLAAAGLAAAGHPLLGATLALAGSDEWLLSARLSVRTHPWLADHVVGGSTLFPGTAFLELVLRAGACAGCGRLAELILAAPLMLPAHGGVRVQVRVAAADATGARAVEVHSRAESAQDADPWVLHASGTVTPERVGHDAAEPDPQLWSAPTSWPPPGAEPIDATGAYRRFAAAGFGYGAAFQGLGAVWRRGAELFADVALPGEVADSAAGFDLHPALLDAALHTILLDRLDEGAAALVPAGWSEVTLAAVAAAALRVRISPVRPDVVRIDLADQAGQPVGTVGELVLRELPALFRPAAPEGLYELTWGAPVRPAPPADDVELPGLPAPLLLSQGLPAGPLPPDLLIRVGPASDEAPCGVGELGAQVLALLQAWCAADSAVGARLVLLTSGAVAATDGEQPDPALAAVWGLVRGARAEGHRIVLVDTDRSAASWDALSVALHTGPFTDEPELAVRDGALLVPRIARASTVGLPLPGGASQGSWRLGVGERGTLEGLGLVGCGDEVLGVLGVGEVRVGVRAAGVNFRDVLNVLGMYPGDVSAFGLEGAGVVLEVGPGVEGFCVGDRVFGMFGGAFGPVAVADARTIARVPVGWSWAQAAAAPVVFLTAWYALRDLGGVVAGERVLVHAAAGGVGMAAVQVARYLGAEVFATASPGKWGAVLGSGVAGERLASSRDTGFEEVILGVTGGAGVDVVLDSLAGEFVDAGLRLLPRGGRFLEMGKTDVRDEEVVAQVFPGVEYQAFDLWDAGVERVGQMLGELVELFEAGVLVPLPVTAWDVRRAPEAFRFMSGARQVGKVVLTMPVPLEVEGTVLVTGGTGGLGALVARHLVVERGVRRLVLVSRSGLGAAGAVELVAELEGLGAVVVVEAVDVGDREALAGVLGRVPVQAPLVGVVHAAGVLDDGVLAAQTPQRLAGVLGPKADAALVLDELTVGADLAFFVVFSSVAGVLGNAGQAGYAAANAVLDAVATRRSVQGLPATSLAWGPWAGAGMTSSLESADLARMARSGLRALAPEQGLALLDAALESSGLAPCLLPVDLDLRRLRTLPPADVPAALRSLVHGSVPARPVARAARGSGPGAGFAARIAALPVPDRQGVVLETVRQQVAGVLGHATTTVDPAAGFKALGLDSLTSVELRNRLSTATGLTLGATLVFDHPTPMQLARHLLAELSGPDHAPVTDGAAISGRPSAVSMDRDVDPVVIVGMACRYPGGVSSPQDLWDLVVHGREGVAAFPQDRGWDFAALFDGAPGAAGRSDASQGGFLAGAADFDHEVFGISPREALAMDPQQRLLLESCWEVLESAGIDPLSLRGSSTGVFTGAIAQDYGSVLRQGVHDSEGYLLTGTTASVASGRVAYTFGFEGPALTVDTACSSSLVALHLAVQALRSGECDLALAGGVTVMATPDIFVEFSRQQGLSPDGRCRAFSDDADGTGWSEGIGILLVERLSDARRNGHRVLAAVAGTAVNSDGASNGLTAPNGPSQQRVIQAALQAAGLTPADVDVVEAHGTGTRLGDPIEAQALLETYGRQRPTAPDGGSVPLWLGSLKSNIGHSQAAAGVGGVIKMVQAIANATLPPTLHAQRPSRYIDWTDGTIALLTQSQPWPADRSRPRRAAVSSFGISGTNAHVILAEPAPGEPAAAVPTTEAAPPTPTEQPVAPTPLMICAAGPAALRGQASRLADLLDEHPYTAPRDLARALVTERARLDHRAVVLGGDATELAAALRAVADGQDHPRVVTGAVRPRTSLAFLFAGQGSQRLGMGAELAASFGVFAEALEAVCAELDPLLEREPTQGSRLREVLWADAAAPGAIDRLAQTGFAQPGLFAVQVALFRLLESWGVTPQVLVGHSVGEVAAAHVSGVLSLPDAAALVVARGRLMQALPAGGVMVAVEAAPEQVLPLLAGREAQVAVAAVNGPRAVVLSGACDAVREVVGVLADQGCRTNELRVSHAFHSPLMDPLLDELDAVAQSLSYGVPRIPVVSTLTGATADPGAGELTSAQYWVRHARETVRYADAIQDLVREREVDRFVELGPDATLTALTRAVLDDLDDRAEAADDTAPGGTASTPEQARCCVSMLRKGRPEPATALAAVAQLHVIGTEIDWDAMVPAGGTGRVTLPTYAFDRRHYWPLPAGRVDADLTSAGLDPVPHPLVSAAMQLAGGELVLTARLSVSDQPWLADHVLGTTVTFPGTGLLELALLAGRQVGCDALEDLTLTAPLLLPEDGAANVQVRVAGDGPTRTVEVHSRAADAGDDQPWVLHAAGTVRAGQAEPPPAGQPWPPADARPLALDGLDDRLAAAGLMYGPVFGGLESAWVCDGALLAQAQLPAAAGAASGYGLHPALLDAALHVLALGTGSGPLPEEPAIRVPFGWSGVRLHSLGADRIRVVLRPLDDGTVALEVSDGDGRPVASVDGLALRAFVPPDGDPGTSHGALHRVSWQPGPTRAAGPVEPAAAAAGAGDERAVRVLRCPSAETTGGSVGAAASVEAVEGVRTVTGLILTAVQEWLQQPAGRLVLLTRNAVVTGPADPAPDPAQAAAWGLVRAARAEHPHRFALLDDDGSATSEELLAELVRTGAPTPRLPLDDEPEIALRDGALLTPRLVRVTLPDAPASAPASALDGDVVPGPGPWTADVLDPGRTVLVTGGTGGLGAVVARHLVTRHGVRHLVLTSRRGADAPGASDLTAELTGLGAIVTVVAADVGDAEALGQVLAAVPAQHPLGTVVHAAGVVDDVVVESLTADRLDGVLAGKLAGAVHLDALTRDQPPVMLVLFSSIIGTLGGAAQAAYAAANAGVDAVGTGRRVAGLPAVVLAWGPWSTEAGMTSRLRDTDLHRMARNGLLPLPVQRGLALLDVALASASATAELPAVLLPVRWQHRALADLGPALPTVLRTLVRSSARRSAPGTSGGAGVEAGAGGLAARLAAVAPGQRRRIVMDVVRTEVALVLGHGDPMQVAPDKSFRDLGFDSLTAVDLRNRLNTVTGLRLPSTLVFDYPSTAALSALVVTQLGADGADQAPTVVRGVGATPVSGQALDGDPIVVVATGCRFPGGVSGPDDLWDLVRSARDAVGPFPTDRGWDLDALYHPDPDHEGTTYVREAAFLHDSGQFDADLFGISPREALMMDPQQRVLLEIAWEVFERAGLSPLSLRGSLTGVFAGVMYHDYASGMQLGTSANVVAGRLSYTFGLEGPSLAVDTACSSSLVAIHLAAQALRSGECELALAGGVTVMSTPDAYVSFSREQSLATDGRCKPFSADADGTNWSEGAGLLLLARQSDARRLGYPVLAVLSGSGVNSDGASNGLTAPNGLAQQRLIRQVLASAGLQGADVDVVEAHATGTRLGDPIEAQALFATYGQDRSADHPLWVGSLKSNIGHSQAASGAGGVIKMIEAFAHRELPAMAHPGEPTPQVDWSAQDVRLLTSSIAWPRGERPRRAAVSSFGISGINAHLILTEPEPEPEPEPLPEPLPGPEGPDGAAGEAPSEAPLPEQPSGGVVPLWLSGASPSALAAQAARLADRLEGSPPPLTATGATGAAVTLVDVALGLAVGRAALEHRAVVGAADVPSTVAALRALAADVRHPAVVTGSVRSGEQPGPAVFVLQESTGPLRPAAALLAASPDFARLLAECDAAVGPVDGCSVTRLVAGHGPDLPSAVALRAARWAVLVSLARLWRELGVEPAAVIGTGPIGELAAACVTGTSTLADAAHALGSDQDLPSSTTALPAGGTGSEPGAVAAALSALLDEGNQIFVGFGDDSALDTAVATLVARRPGLAPLVLHAAGSVDPDDDGARLLVRPGDLFAVGGRVDPVALLVGPAGPTTGPDLSRVALPTYAFQRQHYWLPAAAGPGVVSPGSSAPHTGHPIIDGTVELPDGDAVILTGTLDLGEHPWLVAGSTPGQVTVPGSTWVELAVRAADAVGCDEIATLTEQTPLALAVGHPVDMRVSVGAETVDGTRPVSVHSRPRSALPGEAWTRHAVGALTVASTAAPAAFTEWPPRGAEPVDLPVGRSAYRALWTHGDDVLAEIAPLGQTVGGTGGWGLHPALLDAAVHPLLTELLGATVPAGPVLDWRGVVLHAAGAGSLRVRLSPAQDDDGTVRVSLADGAGRPVATLRAVEPVPSVDVVAPAAGRRAHLYRVEWPQLPEPARGAAPDWVLLGPDPLGVRSRLMRGGVYTETFVDLDALAAAIDAGRATPDAVLATAHPAPGRTAADLAADLAVATIDLVRDWRAGDRFDSAVLVVLTRGAVPAGAGATASADPTGAVWGVLRSAQRAGSGRIVVADIDDHKASWRLLAAAVGTGEPQLALRGGAVRVPRLTRARSSVDAPVGASPRPDGSSLAPAGGTALVCWAAAEPGPELVRRLVRRYGVRHLLLTVGTAEQAETLGATLCADLEPGTEVTVVQSSLTDRDELAAVLARIDPAHPLGLVAYLADDREAEPTDRDAVDGAPDEALYGRLRAVDTVVEVAGAAATGPVVFFSSAAGTIGAPGQERSAAFSGYLDALAAARSAAGERTLCLAWAPWEDAGQPTSRPASPGPTGVSVSEGLELLDAAWEVGDPVLLPVRFDATTLHGVGQEFAILRGLLRSRSRRAAATGRDDAAVLAAMRGRLGALTDDEQTAALMGIVRADVAAVLDYVSPEAVLETRAFREIGLNSLTAFGLRNRLRDSTGLPLPASVLFEQETPQLLVAYLRSELLRG